MGPIPNGVGETHQATRMLTALPFCPQRQPAFDTYDGSLFALYPSSSEEQALQEVPTGLDAISHGKVLSLGHQATGSCQLLSRVQGYRPTCLQSLVLAMKALNSSASPVLGGCRDHPPTPRFLLGCLQPGLLFRSLAKRISHKIHPSLGPE